VAPEAQIELEALPSAGSVENIHRLRYEAGVKLALVQSDVYQAFINQRNAGDANAAAIIRSLRILVPLYNEDLYFIVRADSQLSFVHEIRDIKEWGQALTGKVPALLPTKQCNGGTARAASPHCFEDKRHDAATSQWHRIVSSRVRRAGPHAGALRLRPIAGNLERRYRPQARGDSPMQYDAACRGGGALRPR
jgi:hypothetical protein